MSDNLDQALLGSDGLHWPQTFDGQTWAKEFIRHAQKRPEITTDEGTLIGWFANAIMVGYDRAKQDMPDWAAEEIKATWHAARAAGGEMQAFRIIERMVDRLGYGRIESNPSLVPNKE